MSCDLGEMMEGLENELILQSFHHFTNITAHSFASPTSQLILQPFFHFSYVTGSSLTSPGELTMVIGPAES